MVVAVKNIIVRHIEPRFYGALWCVAAALLGTLAMLAAVDAAGFKSDITVLAALLAVTMATIGWIWNGRNAITMVKKTNALNLLARLGSADVNALKAIVYPYIEAYDRFKREETPERPPMPEPEIQKLLGVYEQMAVAIICGAADERMIHNSQKLVTKRIYQGLYHHIERLQQRDPGYFSEVEKIFLKWHPELRKDPARLANPGSLFSPTRGVDI